jgi:hypothetical protein
MSASKLVRNERVKALATMMHNLAAASFVAAGLVPLFGAISALLLPAAQASARGSPEWQGTIADYELWCNGPKALNACVDEIIRVDRIMASLERYFKRTGQGYNAGLSVQGCKSYCILRHFPYDTPQECASTEAKFRRVARAKPYLWKANLRFLLKEECGIF